MNEFPINKYNIFFFKRIALRRAAAPPRLAAPSVFIAQPYLIQTNMRLLKQPTFVLKKKKRTRIPIQYHMCVSTNNKPLNRMDALKILR